MFSETESQPGRSMATALYLGVPLALLTALAQTTLLRELPLLGIKPNLLLPLVVSWVLLCGLRQGLLLGMVGGLVLEFNSGSVFGAILLAMLVAIAVAALGEVNIFRGAWFLKYGVILGATLLYGLVSLALLGATGRSMPLGVALSRVILPEMAAHLLLMPPIYGVLSAITRRLAPVAVEL